MCKKCNRKSCSGGCDTSQDGKQVANLENKIAELSLALDQLKSQTKFLSGHPILALDQDDDISCFDLTSGLGSDKWEGWALANGAIHKKVADGKNMTTANCLDKFIIGAGDTYDVRTTGGEALHTLTVPEMPAHTHAVTDLGHHHDITDPGHNHSTTQDPHTHSGSSAAHSHGVNIETSSNGSHNHETGYTHVANNTGDGITVRDPNTSGSATSDNGVHSHAVTGSTDSVSAAVTIVAATVNLTVNSAFTGITETQSASTNISVSETGGGSPHNNLPPYYAVIFVQKL